MLVVVSALSKSLTLFETTDSPSFPPENCDPILSLKKTFPPAPQAIKRPSFFSIAANPEIKPETTKLP